MPDASTLVLGRDCAIAELTASKLEAPGWGMVARFPARSRLSTLDLHPPAGTLLFWRMVAPRAAPCILPASSRSPSCEASARLTGRQGEPLRSRLCGASSPSTAAGASLAAVPATTTPAGRHSPPRTRFPLTRQPHSRLLSSARRLHWRPSLTVPYAQQRSAETDDRSSRDPSVFAKLWFSEHLSVLNSRSASPFFLVNPPRAFPRRTRAPMAPEEARAAQCLQHVRALNRQFKA